jgi:hypothetical protein
MEGLGVTGGGSTAWNRPRVMCSAPIPGRGTCANWRISSSAFSFWRTTSGSWCGICLTGTRQLFYARLPDVKNTAGSVAFPLDEVMPASAAYRWGLNHTVAVDDPLELFLLHMTEAGE